MAVDPAGVRPVARHHRWLPALPAAARAPVRPGARAGVRPLHHAGREPGRHHHYQGLRRRGARSRPRRGRVAGLPTGQPRRHPVLLGVRPAHPHGDPGRLHLHPPAGRPPGDRRRSGGRRLLGPRLHDPAAAVAAHPARRDPRPVPAGHGVDHPHPRPAGRAPSHGGGRRRPAPARQWRRAARPGALRLRRRPGRAGGPRPPRLCRRDPRRGRGHGGGQDHGRSARPALLRPPLGPGADRRPRRARGVHRLAAPSHRLRQPGRLPLPGIGARQHRLRAARCHRHRGGGGGSPGRGR